jgi:hypothetical protein
LDLPDALQVIWHQAFLECAELEVVTTGTNIRLERIDGFQGCCNLRKLVLPDSLQEIGTDAFHKCYAISHICVGCETLAALPTGNRR